MTYSGLDDDKWYSELVPLRVYLRLIALFMAETKILYVCDRWNNAAQYKPFSFRASFDH